MEVLFSTDMSLFGDRLVCHTSSTKLGGGLGDGWISDGQSSHGSSRSSSPIIVPQSAEYQNYDVADAGLDWLEGNVNLLDYLGTVSEGCLLEDNVSADPATSSHSTSSAVQILADLAAENAAELDAGTPPSVCSWQNTDITPQVDETADLLDLLAENMDQDMDKVTFEAIQSALNLSPNLSSEDVESILSSPASSPAYSPAPSYVSIESPSSPGPYLPVASPASSSPGYFSAASPAVSVVSGGSSPESTVSYLNHDFLLSPVHSSDSEMYDSDIDLLFNPATPAPLTQNAQPKQKCKVEAASETRRPRPYERPCKPGKPGLPKDVIQQERKQRKKQQNKDAATRYRQKKKAEANGVDDECSQLEARNTELHTSVDTMTKEIQYLKDLLAEVYEARGMKLTFPKNCK